MKLVEWLVAVLGFALLMGWCVACMAALLAAAQALPLDGLAHSALLLIAAGAGLVFALWSAAKVLRVKRL